MTCRYRTARQAISCGHQPKLAGASAEALRCKADLREAGFKRVWSRQLSRRAVPSVAVAQKLNCSWPTSNLHWQTISTTSSSRSRLRDASEALECTEKSLTRVQERSTLGEQVCTRDRQQSILGQQQDNQQSTREKQQSTREN